MIVVMIMIVTVDEAAVVAEEKAILCATVGRFGPQSPKTVIVAEEKCISLATMSLLN